MEIRLNLATCSLKDAEHAIFIIGAYHGMTKLPTVGPITNHGSDTSKVTAAPIYSGPPSPATEPMTDGGELARAQVESEPHPAAVFGGQPDPAAVFGGNAAMAPAGPGLPGQVLSGSGVPFAPDAAAPVVVPPVAPGEAGNVAGAVAGPAGLPSPGTPGPAPSLSPAGVVLDATGLPWDPRIHSLAEDGSHPQTDKGVWRKKRGVQPTEVARVEAELRALLGHPGAGPAVMPPQPPTPPQAPTPPQPPAPPAGPRPDPTTFAELMQRITAGVVAKAVPQDALMAATTAYGLPNIPALAHRPDLIPSVWAFVHSQYPTL